MTWEWGRARSAGDSNPSTWISFLCPLISSVLEPVVVTHPGEAWAPLHLFLGVTLNKTFNLSESQFPLCQCCCLSHEVFVGCMSSNMGHVCSTMPRTQ